MNIAVCVKRIPKTAEEDIFIGVTKESKADVTTIEGSRNLGNIKDVEYFQNKFGYDAAR
jgi:hypothetical protein